MTDLAAQSDCISYRGAHASPRRVRIAIPTYRRGAKLEQLLDRLPLLALPVDVDLDVLVVDNDDQPSAQGIVAAYRDRYLFALDYAHVAEPGLSAVRNFVLERAVQECDMVIMIDDDEVPETQWLSELLRVQHETDADAVIGPVPQILPRRAPRWLRGGRFYDLPSYADKSRMRDGYSGNCLLRTASIQRLGLRFDAALNFAGGEDLLFFRTLVRRGGTLVYAAQAIAHEAIEPSRLTAWYLLRLYFRRGNTLSMCDLKLNGRGIATTLSRGLKSLAVLARGLVTLFPRLVAGGRSGFVWALCDVARGSGGLAGVCGFTYLMYRRS